MISNSASGSFRDNFMFSSLPSIHILHLSKMLVNLILDICLIYQISFILSYKHAFCFSRRKKTAPGKAQPFLP